MPLECLKPSFPKLDLYEVLRLPLEDVSWEWDDFLDACQRTIDHIRIKASQGHCILSTQLDQSTTAIASHGVKHLGIYNSKRALIRSSDGKLRSQSIYYFFIFMPIKWKPMSTMYNRDMGVGVIGAGKFGLALCNLLAEKNPVKLYSRRQEDAASFDTRHQQLRDVVPT